MANNFFKEHFSINADSKTLPEYTIIIDETRISVLSDRLLRVEYDKSSRFIDEATQCVWFRNFDKPAFRIEKEKSLVKVITSKTVFTYNTASHKMESVTLSNGKTVTDYKAGNLKGTYRTLDNTTGKIGLEDGLISTNGVAVFDDSHSHIITSDGQLEERRKTQKDEYYFAYGHDYRGAINALYSLCGKVPLVPRYCLSNWWSRYKAYSQQEYIDLMTKFIDKKIPITVATVDMDWHWVDLKKFGDDGKFKYKTLNPFMFVWGDGWTGYSWNTDLFPDYKGFLRWLQERNFKVTLNIHPAQGVRPFEDMYADFAKGMGEDPKEKKPFYFDITDTKYVENYFKVLHKPYENDGVDFWWIDWQQGKTTSIKGLDPLWALNHYHYLYSKKDNKRPLILSRYAQIGSHRYPLGFSGDTTINWSCLDFQPYFTANAANVGYTWWSHDIGGHHWGSKDDELYLRWVQFGLFSPIMRLHSTSNEFMGKEPWKFRNEIGQYAIDCLRLRHRMLPYIYSMNYRTHKDGIAICEPLYYQYPEEKKAYEYKNEYFFGSELIAAPITEKCSPKTNMAKVKVWLPKGRFTDIFTGRIYQGGREYILSRDLSSIPVFAKEGAIIPLSQNAYDNNWKNPEDMELLIYRGNGKFPMYEDDGETLDYEKGKSAVTEYRVLESGSSLLFEISKAEGDLSVIPEKRNYTLSFRDVAACEKIIVKANGKTKEYKSLTKDYVSLSLSVSASSGVQIELVNYEAKKNADTKETLIDAISKFQMKNDIKLHIFGSYINNFESRENNFPEPYRSVIDEILALR
ncbi:MAG: TIM-barrel domain-containing protein [Acutalibacteraceae bacterium]